MAKQARRKPTIAMRRYSRAEILLPVEIRSAAAQRVVARTLLRCSRALYTIEVVFNAIGDQDEVEQVEHLIIEMLEACYANMEERYNDVKRRMDDAGLEHNTIYTAPMKLTFRISSSQLRRYADLVLKLDALTDLVDVMRLNGAMSPREASNLIYEARNEILELGRRLSMMEGRARQTALGSEGGEEVVEAAEIGAKDVVTGDGDSADWLKDAEDAEEELKAARLTAVG